ncbi:uncharacterized protein LOC122848426 [Aphidius gifuensis]|uniref:uncharacterized protein LOC122848426 n=1 Tax=Aphidius gifuensis TaxID=684658 RepID=UPI001CDC1F1F|nr:uncharacterized protein LOC122848426 [Aphidius gifuensis]
MIYGLLIAGAIARATIRRYSVAKTIILTSLIFLIVSGLTGVSSVPSYNHEISKITARKMQPWEKPCGTLFESSTGRPLQRHSAHRSLKRVRTRLKVAKNHIQKDRHDIEKVYSKINTVLKGQYNFTWLPKKQLQWYYNELWCMEKNKKAEYALPRLHDALQRFAITFYSLRKFKFKIGIEDNWAITKRNEIISAMETEVLSILCEVETAITNLGHQVPHVHKSKIVIENPAWNTEGDMTVSLIQDWGVLRLYRIFLNDWIRAFRNATAKGPGTCDSNTVKPIIFKSKNKNQKKTTRLKTKRHMKKKKSNEQQLLRDNIIHENNKKMIQEKKRELRLRLQNRMKLNESQNL